MTQGFPFIRKYFLILGRSERAKDNPLRAAYTKRCSAIRSEKSRGTITAEFAAAAQDMAKRRLEQAEEDDMYAAREYYKDLERVKLYTDTNNRLYNGSDEAIQRIADEIGMEYKTVKQYLAIGLLNERRADICKDYDENGEEPDEDVTVDYSSEPDKLYSRTVLYNALYAAYDRLSYAPLISIMLFASC